MNLPDSIVSPALLILKDLACIKKDDVPIAGVQEKYLRKSPEFNCSS